MTKNTILLAALALLVSGTASADQWVNGYTKKDGTYVQGHYRSSPNQYRYDNYSSQGNVNPYTGESGSQRNEWSSQPSYNQNYGNYGYGQRRNR